MSDQTTIYADVQTYDLVHTGSKGKDFEFYRGLAKPGQHGLEVACGTGRLTIPLAQNGFKMTGL